MSNDFEVHSFGNLDISELEEAKEEFLSWCDEEIQAKTQEIDLYTLTKEEFIEKYEDDFNNGLSCIMQFLNGNNLIQSLTLKQVSIIGNNY
jgi:uncharacterized membrane protein YgaE (UPF0421/DUF939 family)